MCFRDNIPDNTYDIMSGKRIFNDMSFFIRHPVYYPWIFSSHLSSPLLLLRSCISGFRISPFFTLIGGAILFGILPGITLDTILLGIVSGVGKEFPAFGIIILCGAVIAKILQDQHRIEEIVSEITQCIKNPPVIAGLSGYLLAVPITCCNTAYVILDPIPDHSERD